MFYGYRGRLWLRMGERVFDLDGDATVSWRLDRRKAVFAASDPAGPCTIRYRKGPDLSDDPTPFVDDEDFDLGLFIANVLSNDERRVRYRAGPELS